MSRRKQSVPCKVEGNIDAQQAEQFVSTVEVRNYNNFQRNDSAQSDVSLDIDDSSGSSLHNGHETSVFRRQVALKDFAAAKQDGNVYYCSFAGCLASFNTLQEVQNHMRIHGGNASDTKQQRFSARIRAKSLLLKAKCASKTSDANANSRWQKKRKLQEAARDQLASDKRADTIEASSRAPVDGYIGLLPNDDLINFHATSPGSTMAAAADEELTCAVCKKSFLSKYGLLTHSEIHGATETSCSKCNRSFFDQKSFVLHQCRQQQTSASGSKDEDEKKPSQVKYLHGFNDLSMIDFTCTKFPVIAERLCRKTCHLLAEQDRFHYFMCKKCRLVFPTLPSLQYHIQHNHPAAEELADAKTDLSSASNGVQSAQEDGEGLAVVKGGAENKDEADDASLDDFAHLLGLKRASSAKPEAVPTVASAGGDAKDVTVGYGMDTDLIQTSPLLAYMNVPKWLRKTEQNTAWTFSLFVRDDNKSYIATSENIAMGKSPSRLASGPFSCRVCAASFRSMACLSTHQATTVCGVNVGSSRTGRKMFWCQLCNYASFEKSTILRHQRTHTGVRPFSCKLCSLAFTTKANCERHIRKRHSGLLPEEKDIKSAVVCNYDLLRKIRNGEMALQDLVNSPPPERQQGKYKFQCQICRVIFPDQQASENHMMMRHGISSSGGSSKTTEQTFNHAAHKPHHPGSSIERERAGDSINVGIAKISAEIFSRGAEQQQVQRQLRSPNRLPRSPDKQQQQQQQATGGDCRRGVQRKAIAKPPQARKLIPLAKIAAYNKASLQLRDYFERNYSDVLTAFNVNERRESKQDVHEMSAKLQSLLANVSRSLLKRASDTSPPAPAQQRPRLATPPPPHHKKMNCSINNTAFRPIRPKILSQRGGASAVNSSSSYDDMVQLFADGQLDRHGNISQAADGHSTTGQQQQQQQPSQTHLAAQYKAIDVTPRYLTRAPPNNREKPGEKDRGSSDLTPIEKLVGLTNQPDLLTAPQNNHVNTASERTPTSARSNADFMREIKVKYKTINARQRQLQPKGSLTWKFIPNPPRHHDDRGRFIKSSVKSTHSAHPPPIRGVFQKKIVNNSLSSFMVDSTRPTMVDITQPGSSSPTLVDVAASTTIGDEQSASPAAATSEGAMMMGEARQCPKCDKSFPWASSLRRHIMTHTGLKPYMCAKCSMRFTTRSNLLRHAYRRHNLVRGSEERHRVLVTLSMREQQEYAEMEAQKLVMQDVVATAFSAGGVVGDQDAPQIMIEDKEENGHKDEVGQSSSFMDTSGQSPAVTPSGSKQKRYACGACNVQFANRSNVVRHLGKLHGITKDDEHFKQLLVRVDVNPASADDSLPPAPPTVTIADDVISAEESSSPVDRKAVAVAEVTSPADDASVVMSSPPPGGVVHSPDKIDETNQIYKRPPKEFMCAICMIGFTKRNNAARHLQQQHNMQRRGDPNFAKYIIRLHPPPAPSEQDGDLQVVEEKYASGEGRSRDGGDDGGHERNDLQLSEADLADEDESSTEPPPLFDLPEIKAEVDDDADSMQLECSETVPDLAESAVSTDGDSTETSSKALIVRLPGSAKRPSRKISPFACGFCKRVFDDCDSLKEHLESHDIPHPWHCPVCGVPFTSKYNCQRHVTRRHGRPDIAPTFVGGPKTTQTTPYVGRSSRRRLAPRPSLVVTEPPPSDPSSLSL